MHWIVIDIGPDLLHLRSDAQARVIQRGTEFIPSAKKHKEWPALPMAKTLLEAKAALA